MKRITILGLLIVFAVPLFSQTGKWKKTQKINTIEAYQEFIATYPESEYADEAKVWLAKLIEIREWNLALSANKKEDYEEFLRLYGDSPFANEAKSKIEDCDWQLTLGINTYDAYSEYLNKYPRSTRIGEIEKKLGRLQKDKAKESFNVTKVILTEEEQTFLTGYTLGANGTKPIYEVGTPLKGESFVIVEWNLGQFMVHGDKFSLQQSELVLLEAGVEPQVGYVSILSKKTIWQGAEGFTTTYSIGGNPSGKHLFVIKKENINGLALRFLGKEYQLIIAHK